MKIFTSLGMSVLVLSLVGGCGPSASGPRRTTPTAGPQGDARAIQIVKRALEAMGGAAQVRRKLANTRVIIKMQMGNSVIRAAAVWRVSRSWLRRLRSRP